MQKAYTEPRTTRGIEGVLFPLSTLQSPICKRCAGLALDASSRLFNSSARHVRCLRDHKGTRPPTHTRATHCATILYNCMPVRQPRLPWLRSVRFVFSAEKASLSSDGWSTAVPSPQQIELHDLVRSMTPASRPHSVACTPRECSQQIVVDCDLGDILKCRG